jgi:hypothetical protein
MMDGPRRGHLWLSSTPLRPRRSPRQFKVARCSRYLDGREGAPDSGVRGVRRRGDPSVFRALGVQVLESVGSVYTVGYQSAEAKTDTSRLLGPLARAQAIVTDGSQAQRRARRVLAATGRWEGTPALTCAGSASLDWVTAATSQPKGLLMRLGFAPFRGSNPRASAGHGPLPGRSGEGA